MTTPTRTPRLYYQDDTVELWHGDALNVLRAIPDCSVQAIVCDPQYGLSQVSPTAAIAAVTAWASGDRERVPSADGMKRCLYHLVRNPVVGDAKDADIGRKQKPVQFRITCRVPGLAVVLRSIYFNDDAPFRQVEVRNVGPAVSLDHVLVDELNTKSSEGVSEGQLALRVRQGAASCVGGCTCYRETSEATLRVVVRLCDHTLAQASRSTEVVALAGAEVRAVLALDLSRGTGELLAADRADHPDSVLCLGRPQSVGAGAGAGGGAAVFQPDGVDRVRGAADGAVTFDVLIQGLPVSGHSPRVRPAGFMGNEWDSFVPPPAIWDECLRVLTPGGHLLAFAGSRMADLAGLSIRLAGFEVRDEIDVIGSRISWLYGTGMPKSKTVLKPAHEPILVARKPFAGSEIATVQRYGTGGLNTEACRVAHGADVDLSQVHRQQQGEDNGWRFARGLVGAEVPMYKPEGRWPSNVVLIHAPLCDPATGEIIGDACADGCVDGCAVLELDQQCAGTRAMLPGRPGSAGKAGTIYSGPLTRPQPIDYGDSGGAARFFSQFRWQAKASASERPKVNGVAHPTVKPLALMRWLVRLVTPPGGTVLDWCAGSGTTGQAARIEGFRCVLIEREAKYIPHILTRLKVRPAEAENTPPAREATPIKPGREAPADLFSLTEEAS